MQQLRTKWRADRGTRAFRRLGEIKASIVALGEDDLLDLHDIFLDAPATPLGQLSTAEAQRRGLLTE